MLRRTWSPLTVLYSLSVAAEECAIETEDEDDEDDESADEEDLATKIAILERLRGRRGRPLTNSACALA